MNQDKEFTEQGTLLPFLRRMLQYAWRHKRHLLSFAGWISLVAAADALFPIALKLMIDNALTPQLEAMRQNPAYQPDFTEVYLYAGVFLLITMVSVIGIYQFIYHTGRVQEFIITDMRQELFEKLQKMSFRFFDRTASGWLLTRLTSDTDRVSDVVAWGLMEALWGSLMIIFCLTSLFYFSWELALIVLLSIPLMLVLSIKIRLLVLKYTRQSRKLNSEITASYTEHINGVALIKSTAQEATVSEGFSRLSEKMRKASYGAGYFTAMYFPVLVFIGAMSSAAVVYFGGNMAIALPPILTVGVLAAAFDYTMKIFFPIVDLSMFYALAQSSLTAGERIFSLLDEPIDLQDAPDATPFGRINGKVEFKKVDFAYRPDQPILTNFNLTIEKGQSIALVGATGEGKTTIASLVARFYEPVGGAIWIDDEDYTTKTIASLRQQIGVVLQTPHLFSGTIRENICFARPNATESEVHQALRLVGAEDFIPKLEEEVGENGENLSVGERQLISFARAIITQPRILIMDEATANIDTLTEGKIQHGIAQMLQGRTSIIIAHRLSTIKNCDRILVIEKGNVIEDGTHHALLQRRGKYFDLYTRQLRAEAAFEEK